MSNNEKNITQKKKLLELEVKHLNNELTLLKKEYNSSVDKYFDIYSNMENKVAEKTQQLVSEINATKRAQQALLFTRFSIDNAEDSFVWLDHNGNIFDVNQTACSVFGYNREEFLKQQFKNMFTDKSTMEEVNDSQPAPQKATIAAIMYKKSTATFSVDIQIHHFQFEHNEYRCCIIHDTTHTKQIESMMLQAQKMETVGNLAGGLAHDFNNVLSGIRASLSMLKYLSKDGNLTDESCFKLLDIADKSTERAADMVQQLLSLSKKQELKLTQVDLRSVVNNVLDICHNTLPKEITCTLELPEMEATVNGDQAQLEQVLLNLCINAAHSMTIMRQNNQPHGGNLTVKVEKRAAQSPINLSPPNVCATDSWLLIVTDSGVGMHENEISRIFDPFYTTKDKDKGTGLGLAMVYNIIHQHQGVIDVSSEIELGTQFSICLPALDTRPKQESVDVKSKGLIMGSGTILVIDDEEVIRKTSKLILEQSGYSVLTAHDGEDGVKKYIEHQDRISAVVLDMAMPKLCGKDCYIQISQINPDVKVLMASGFKQDPRVNESIKLGVKDFLQKPFSIYELTSKVKEIINS